MARMIGSQSRRRGGGAKRRGTRPHLSPNSTQASSISLESSSSSNHSKYSSDAKVGSPRHSLYELATFPTSGMNPCKLPQALNDLAPEMYPSVSSAKRAVRRGHVVVNGEMKPTTYVCRAGDKICRRERHEPSNFLAHDFDRELPDVKVIYENDDIAVVSKPPGIQTIGKTPEVTLQKAICRILKPTAATRAVLRKPRCTHRLDKPTGGLVLCAKTQRPLQQLSLAFQQRRIRKRYRALVSGRLKESKGVIDTPMEGKETRTDFAVVEYFSPADLRERWCVEAGERLPEGASLVDLWPKHGRTHQIRRHMKSIGNPLVQDLRYGAVPIMLKPRRRRNMEENHNKDSSSDNEEHDRSGEFYLWAVELHVPRSCCYTGSGSSGSDINHTNEDGSLRENGEEMEDTIDFEIQPPCPFTQLGTDDIIRKQ
eukprot:jgi/Bigna1/79437/fgenesh1_pg.62_\